MNYGEQLSRPLSKDFLDIMVQEVFQHPSDSEILYALIFHKDKKIAWRAAWACQKISEKHPEWFTDTQFKGLTALAISTTHEGLKRGCLSILSCLPFPDPIPVDFINACFEWMVSAKSPIAVQALSMKLLFRICTVEPDFTIEFRTYLETLSPGDYSKGFNAARNNIFKKLNAK